MCLYIKLIEIMDGYVVWCGVVCMCGGLVCEKGYKMVKSRESLKWIFLRYDTQLFRQVGVPIAQCFNIYFQFHLFVQNIYDTMNSDTDTDNDAGCFPNLLLLLLLLLLFTIITIIIIIIIIQTINPTLSEN